MRFSRFILICVLSTSAMSMTIEPFICIDVSENAPEITDTYDMIFGSYKVDYSFPLQPGITLGINLTSDSKASVAVGAKFGLFKIHSERNDFFGNPTTMFSDSNYYKIVSHEAENEYFEYSFPIRIRVYPILDSGFNIIGGFEFLSVTKIRYTYKHIGILSEQWDEYLEDENSVEKAEQTYSGESSETYTNNDILLSYGIGWTKDLLDGTLTLSVSRHVGVEDIFEFTDLGLHSRVRTTISIEYSRVLW